MNPIIEHEMEKIQDTIRDGKEGKAAVVTLFLLGIGMIAGLGLLINLIA